MRGLRTHDDRRMCNEISAQIPRTFGCENAKNSAKKENYSLKNSIPRCMNISWTT